MQFPILRFNIKLMMTTVAAVAAALAIYKSSNIFVAIMVMWMPFGMIAERFLAEPPRTPVRPSVGQLVFNYGVMSVCASLASLADWMGCSNAFGVLSPDPLFGIMPRMIVSSEWPTWHLESIEWVFEIIPFGLIFAIVPFVTFFVLNFYLGRTVGPTPVPLRFPILLAIATGFSAYSIIGDWQDGIKYQGIAYTKTIAALNFGVLVVLWGLWFAIRRNAPKPAAFALATLFHCWIFWIAFPWMGMPI